MPTNFRPTITDGEARTHWVLVELRNLLNPAFGAAATFLITLWTVQPESARGTWPALLLLVGALALVVAWLVGYFTFLRPRYSELSRDKALLDQDLGDAHKALQAALDSLLSHLIRDQGFAKPTCRISAYSVEHDQFVLLSRRSTNPMHERRGRATYELGVGVIGDAWAREGAHQRFDVDTRAEWEAELVASGGFSVETAQSLKMFSKSLIAVRVDSAEGDKIGMLVLESEDADEFTASSIDRLRRRPLTSAVTELISGWHQHFPRAKEWHYELESGKPKRYLAEPQWKNPR